MDGNCHDWSFRIHNQRHRNYSCSDNIQRGDDAGDCHLCNHSDSERLCGINDQLYGIGKSETNGYQYTFDTEHLLRGKHH